MMMGPFAVSGRKLGGLNLLLSLERRGLVSLVRSQPFSLPFSLAAAADRAGLLACLLAFC